MDEEDQLGVVTDTTPIYNPIPAFAAAIRYDFDKWLGQRRDYYVTAAYTAGWLAGNNYGETVKLENYCPTCKHILDMPIVGDTGHHILLRCPDCGGTSHQAMERDVAEERSEWAGLS